MVVNFKLHLIFSTIDITSSSKAWINVSLFENLKIFKLINETTL